MVVRRLDSSGSRLEAWGLSVVPLIGILIAAVSVSRRRATGLDFVAAPFASAEILAIAAVAVAHSAIVFAAL